MAFRLTKQKEILYNLLEEKGHLSVDKIKEYLLNEKISRATIYRNLNILAKEGKIRQIIIDDREFYETIKENHYHFVCDKCHKIYDIDSSLISLRTSNVPSFNHLELTLHGTCENCQKKEKN